MTDFNHDVFDGDQHLYESPEVVTDYLPERYRRDVQFVKVGKRTRLAIKGTITEYMPNPTFEVVAAPGSHVAYYKGDNPDGLSLRELAGDPIKVRPEFREPGPRLERLDELGVMRTLNFPTIANIMEFTLDGDPELTHEVVHAINQYLHEVWTYNTDDRIYTIPVVTLPIIDRAIEELGFLLDRGAKAIIIRPAPVTGYNGPRSFGLPEFDPFWARVEEAGIGVCMHSSFPPLNKYYSTWEPNRSDSAFKPTPLKNMLIAHREIEDALAALVCQGVLTRFPKLRVLTVENGASWAGHLLEGLAHTYKQMPQEFEEHPVEVFKRNVYVNPFWEDDVAKLVDLVGENRVVFGSDWPHPEGLAEPLAYYDYLDEANIEGEVRQKIMADNLKEFMALSA